MQAWRPCRKVRLDPENDGNSLKGFRKGSKMMPSDVRKHHAGHSVGRGNVGVLAGGINAPSLEEHGQTCMD